MDADREFWLTVRAALLMFVKAIEKRYAITSHTFKGDSNNV